MVSTIYFKDFSVILLYTLQIFKPELALLIHPVPMGSSSADLNHLVWKSF